MDEIARAALDPVGRKHRNYDAGISSTPEGSRTPVPDSSSTPGSTMGGHSQRPRIKRIARKPLKIASAAIGRRRNSTEPSASASSSSSSSASASNGGSGHASQNLRMTASLQAHAQAQDSHAHAHASSASDDVIAKGEAYKIAKGRAKPLDGEKEACMVRIRVVRCEGLVAKDRGNTSDP